MNELTLREGYKTLVANRLADESVVLTVHRPPHVWVSVYLSREQQDQLCAYLGRSTNG